MSCEEKLMAVKKKSTQKNNSVNNEIQLWLLDWIFMHHLDS